MNGYGSSNPTDFVNVGGILYFSADDGVSGRELWKTSGTEAQTELLKDTYTGGSPYGFSTVSNLTSVGGRLFFSTHDAANGKRLWVSDGTSQGTAPLRSFFGSGSSPYELTNLTNLGGQLFFTAIDDATGNAQLWKSDGTVFDTVLVKHLAGTNSLDLIGLPRYLTNINGVLFFRANDGLDGVELWRSDGTGVGTFPITNIGAFGWRAEQLTNVAGTLFFVVEDEVAQRRDLWASDGTVLDTAPVMDVGPFSTSVHPFSLTNVLGTLYFSAEDDDHGRELWTFSPRLHVFNFLLDFGISVADALPIRWIGGGFAEAATISFYYDTDNDSATGLVAIGSAPFEDGVGAWTWENIPIALHDQSIYIYASVADGIEIVADYVDASIELYRSVTLVIPGILGSLPAFGHFTDWLLFTDDGTNPEHLRLDPFFNTYRNLSATLSSAGDGHSVHVIESPYDWRRSVDGPSNLGDVDIVHPDSGVEYLVYWIDKAAEWWAAPDIETGKEPYNPDYFVVDLVAHSMGGLVARELIQSLFYDQLLSRPDLHIESRDFVDALVMLDTPNHGSVKAYTYDSYLNQLPPIAGALAGEVAEEVLDHLIEYVSAELVGLPVLFDLIVGGLLDQLTDEITGRVSEQAEQIAANYVGLWTAGLHDLFPAWSDYDTELAEEPVNSLLQRINAAENLSLLPVRARVAALAADIGGNRSTPFRTSTIPSLVFEELDLPLTDIAFPAEMVFGSVAIVYPFGDPHTRNDGPINGVRSVKRIFMPGR